MKRPPDISSMVAAALAMSAGWRKVMGLTRTMRPMRSVSRASPARVAKASVAWGSVARGKARWSERANTANPSDSARRAAWREFVVGHAHLGFRHQAEFHGASYQPRRSQSSRSGRSAPMVVAGPCPGRTSVRRAG